MYLYTDEAPTVIASHMDKIMEPMARTSIRWPFVFFYDLVGSLTYLGS
jgi:hypothetical protein